MPHCTHCGEYTTERGPFGEALHGRCWEAEDEAIARVERRTAEKHGYDTSYYARVDAEAKAKADHERNLEFYEDKSGEFEVKRLSPEAAALFDADLYTALQLKQAR